MNGCLRLQLFLLGNTTHARRHTRKRYGHTRARGFICINAVVFYVALIHVSSYNGNNPGHINFLYFVSKLIRYQCYISNCLRNNMIGLKASGGSDLQWLKKLLTCLCAFTLTSHQGIQSNYKSSMLYFKWKRRLLAIKWYMTCVLTMLSDVEIGV